MQTDEELLIRTMTEALKAIRSGGSFPPVPPDDAPDVLAALAEEVNAIRRDVAETARFALELSLGRLDTEPPGRRNYLAAPLKELHSQLSSVAWKAVQLRSGQMVSRLDRTGELYDAFNGLLEMVESSSGQKDGDWSLPANSFRYHQILSALNHLHIMVVEVNAAGRVLFANAPARDMLGGLEHLHELPPGRDAGALIKTLDQLSRSENRFPVCREVYDAADGTWYKITSDHVLLADGQYGYLHMIDDISEWKSFETQLRFSATRDALTGLFNRKAGLDVLESLTLHGKPGETHCAAFLDLDRLKYINDTFGHTEGDFAICSLAGILQASVRDMDTVSRFGGDEFLILFRACTAEAAGCILRRILQKTEAFNREADRGYQLSFSFGLITFPSGGGESALSLLERVDAEMYRHKLSRRDESGNGAS